MPVTFDTPMHLARKENIMLNERIEAVRPIAEKLGQVERSLNQSISLLSELLACIPAARVSNGTRIPVSTGIEACESLTSALSAAARGYKDVIQAHSHFAQDRDNLGLRTINFGDVGDCPDMTDRSEVTALRVVRAA
jgi:hypothetical protein